MRRLENTYFNELKELRVRRPFEIRADRTRTVIVRV